MKNFIVWLFFNVFMVSVMSYSFAQGTNFPDSNAGIRFNAKMAGNE
ncbi:hypothetical protein [Flavobacterium inviolabile]|nr:hypothetical protein [Flavobacterium inviolabile]